MIPRLKRLPQVSCTPIPSSGEVLGRWNFLGDSSLKEHAFKVKPRASWTSKAAARFTMAVERARINRRAATHTDK